MEFVNLKTEQEQFKNNMKELDELKLMLNQVSKEEELQRAQAILFEEKIKQVSLFIQKENQNLKSLENTMYKAKLSSKIEQFNDQILNMQEDKNSTNLHLGLSQADKVNIFYIWIHIIFQNEVVKNYHLEEQCNMDLLLVLLRKQSNELQEKLNKKMNNIKTLKQTQY